ncbi:MAG: thiamine pyrophosphate-binding protein, partial [Oscillospiraceae bacterium]
MIRSEEFFECLSEYGLDFFAGVPDSLLKSPCAYLAENSGSYYITANEGNAVALAAGHYLATGKAGVVFMQNSGIGNAVNPLLSLADEMVYDIPLLLLTGWRGEPGVPDEPQHKK